MQTSSVYLIGGSDNGQIDMTAQEAFERSSPRSRLSEVMNQGAKGSVHSLKALPSNIQAIEAMMRFADGTHQHVALCGPSGWGKSHLLQAVARDKSGANLERIEAVSALQWARLGSRSDQSEALILDDVQDLLAHPRARHYVRHQLEMRFRTKKPTLVAWSSGESSRRVRSLLPFTQYWSIAEISEPSVPERRQVAFQIAGGSGLQISNSIASLIARHLNGNGRSIVGAVQRLRLVKSKWTAREDVIPACGVLSPYLLGQNGWDPRDHAYEAVYRTIGKNASVSQTSEICSYILMKEMGLGETETANFLRVSPSTVYNLAKSVESTMKDPLVYPLVFACRNAILCGFEEE